MPSGGAKPTIGEIGKNKFVDEDRVEVVVNDVEERTEIKKAIQELKRTHPYEEPAYEVYKLEDL